MASNSVSLLENCSSYFDGCNNCKVMDGEELACTKKMCEVYEEPECTSWVPTLDQKVTQGCLSWYDGCNTCMVNDNLTIKGCTKMACKEMNKPYCLFYADEKDFNYFQVGKFDSEGPIIKKASVEHISQPELGDMQSDSSCSLLSAILTIATLVSIMQ